MRKNKEKWYYIYGYLKWEFLRRNHDYQKDFDRLTQPPFKSVKSSKDGFYWMLHTDEEIAEEFRSKWKLGYPINYRFTIFEFDDQVLFDLYAWVRGETLTLGIRSPVNVLGKEDTLWEWIIKEKFDGVSSIPQTEETWKKFIQRGYIRDNKMVFIVKLEFDKEFLVDSFKEILKFIEPGKDFILNRKPSTRERHRFEEYENYLKVWDMRQEGRSFPEIAREVFPDDFKDPSELEEDDPDPNPESALVKVRQYYEKADRLIKSGI